MDKHSLHTSRPPTGMSQVEQLAPQLPSIFRNYISFVGAAIVIASLVSVVLLFLLEITSAAENPNLGILTYIILPSILLLAVLVALARVLLDRRRRHSDATAVLAVYRNLNL